MSPWGLSVWFVVWFVFVFPRTGITSVHYLPSLPTPYNIVSGDQTQVLVFARQIYQLSYLLGSCQCIYNTNKCFVNEILSLLATHPNIVQIVKVKEKTVYSYTHLSAQYQGCQKYSGVRFYVQQEQVLWSTSNTWNTQMQLIFKIHLKSILKAEIFLSLFPKIMTMVLRCEETEDGEQMGFLAVIRQAWLLATAIPSALAYGAQNTSSN